MKQYSKNSFTSDHDSFLKLGGQMGMQGLMGPFTKYVTLFLPIVYPSLVPTPLWQCVTVAGSTLHHKIRDSEPTLPTHTLPPKKNTHKTQI
jgi:hypothetical protein